MPARKTSTSPTRIWKFGARVKNPELVHEILWQARRYYNRLVEIERKRSERFAAIRRRFAPELADLEVRWLALDEEIEGVYRRVKHSRQKHWQETSGEKKRFLLEADAEKVLALRAEQKALTAFMRELRAEFSSLLDPAKKESKRRRDERGEGLAPVQKALVNAEVLAEMLSESDWSEAWKEIARSDEQAHREHLAARAACGLATGTYLAVEESFDRAKKDSSPRPPRFRSFDGTGKLAIQLRRCESVAAVMAGTSALRIGPAPVPIDKPRRGSERMAFVAFDQSIPRGERRKIVILTKLHRRPPQDAVVKWAALIARRVGSRTVYEFQLTLEHPSFAEPKRPSGARDPEHVRIGWASVERGVRVAHWPGGEVVVPNEILSQHEHANSIESAADKAFEKAKKRLRLWMRGGPHRLTGWHWILRDRDRAALRRICIEYADYVLGDAHAVWCRWKKHRKERGLDLYEEPRALRRWLGSDQQEAFAMWAYVWARKDAHLQQLVADSRRRFEHRREAFFRHAAIRVATEFSSITVDDYKISEMKELPEITLPGDIPRDRAQHNAQAAAPGRFREILREVMGPRCEGVNREKRERGTCQGENIRTSIDIETDEATKGMAAE